MKKQWWIAGGAVLLLGAVARWQLARQFVEEPDYRVLRSFDDVEIRRYAPSVRAETTVEGTDPMAATNEGFRRLAGYIFGGNRQRSRIAMTAPVSQSGEAAVPSASERIAMTSPVTQSASADAGAGASAGEGDRWTVAFTMPSGRSLGDLPAPDDARVTLRSVPERTVAVLRYPGTSTEAKIAETERTLRARLEREGLRVRGSAEVSRYDPPSTLPLLRRNEVWIEIEPDGTGTTDARDAATRSAGTLN